MTTHEREAVMAALFGLGFALVALFGSVAVVGYGAIALGVPDPFSGGPASWAEVRAGATWTLVFAAIEGILISSAVVLLRWAGERPNLSWRRIAAIPAATTALAAVAMAVALVPHLDEGHGPACATFAPDRVHPRRTAWGVVKCGTLNGTPAKEAQREIGKAPVNLRIEHGRVAGAKFAHRDWFDGVLRD